MTIILRVNGKEIDLYDEKWYCSTHDRWNYGDDEMHCCACELEGQLIAAERWAKAWRQLSLSYTKR